MKIRDARTPEELVEAAAQLDPQCVAALEETTRLALAGSSDAAAGFVRNLRMIVDDVAADLAPDDFLHERGYRQVLLVRGLSAPMTGWVATYGFGPGTAASVAACARELAGVVPIAEPAGVAPEVVVADVLEFQRRVLTNLRLGEDPLTVVARELELDKTELGALFGVSRQALTEWIDRGIPSGRMRAVSQVLRVVSILARKLKPGRMPLVVRRPAPVLGGRTLLEVMRDDPDSAVESVEEAFDWSGVA